MSDQDDDLPVFDRGKQNKPKREPAFRIPMTQKKARDNLAYMAIVEAIVGTWNPDGTKNPGLLDMKGCFSKEEVLKQVHLIGTEFNWQVIRDIVQKDYGEETYPVSAAYFKKRQPGDDPSAFLTQGHGKKTAGYVVARPEHREVVEKKNKTRAKQIRGAADHCVQHVLEARANIEDSPMPVLIVDLEKEVKELERGKEDE